MRRRREGNAERDTGMYSSPPLSEVSVACGRLWSENIKRKGLEIKFICFKLHMVLSTVMKSHAVPLCPAWDVNHPLVLCPSLYVLPTP